MTKGGAVQPPSVRKASLDTLLEIFEQNVFCDMAMHRMLSRCNWEKRDRSFYRRLVSGTVERAIELDFILDQFSKVKGKRMKPVIRNILRMSLYQILYMEQIPDAAVCNEAVKLVEQRKLYPLKGFVNGVLRTIIRKRDEICYPEKGNLVSYLTIRYSMPEWIVKRWLAAYGAAVTEEILAAFLAERTYLTIRRQCSRVSEPVFTEALEREGVSVEKGRFFSYAYRIQGYSTLEEMDAFRRGYFSVQDESSMFPGHISGVKKGDFVIDLCAAPGGKAMHVADLLEGTGTVAALDLTAEKVKRMEENRERLQVFSMMPEVNDARIYQEKWKEKADVVIADLPCSGLGVIGRKSDIKYKTKEEDIFSLARLQREILSVAIRYLKQGGRLIYSTCTIAKEENEDQVCWIEENLPAERVSIEELLPEALRGKTGTEGYLQLLPCETGTDGFFISAFRKTGENFKK